MIRLKTFALWVKFSVFITFLLINPSTLLSQEECSCDDVEITVNKVDSGDCCTFEVEVTPDKNTECIITYGYYDSASGSSEYDLVGAGTFTVGGCDGYVGWAYVRVNGETCRVINFDCDCGCDNVNLEITEGLASVGCCTDILEFSSDCAYINDEGYDGYLIEYSYFENGVLQERGNKDPHTITGSYCDDEEIELKLWANGELCEHYQSGPCECNCNVSISQGNCRLRACTNVFSSDCAGPVSFQWDTPSGPATGLTTSTFFFTCNEIEAVGDGQYCVTITDANGCSSTNCVEVVGCERCEDCNWERSINTIDREVAIGLPARYITCEPEAHEVVCSGFGYLLKNTSGCTDQQVTDIYNASPVNTVAGPLSVATLLDIDDFANCLQSDIRDIAGCEDSVVELHVNAQGELTHSYTYNCETCPIEQLSISTFSFNVDDECETRTETFLHTVSNGNLNCGPCYD